MLRIIFALFLLVAGSPAYARCWNECVLPNPFGGCGQYVRVCDLENPGAAAADLSQDVNRATDRLRRTWQRVWGEVPAPMREVLERHPVSILATIYPETRAYALVIASLEEYVARAGDRSRDSKEVLANTGSPAWKEKILKDGEAFLLWVEGYDTSSSNYPAEQRPNFEKYDQPWKEFTSCVGSANDFTEGDRCFRQLKRNVLDLM